MPKSPSKNKTIVPQSRMVTFGAVGVGLLLSVTAVLWGRADEGQIDVSGVIAASNAAARESIKRGETPEVPIVNSSQNTNVGLPNGGLVGTGKSEPEPVPEPEVESASTTDETEEVSEEVGEGESEEAEGAAEASESTPDDTEGSID